MVDVQEHLTAMEIQVWSPDRTVQAALRGQRDVRFRFSAGSYGTHHEDALARQVSTLLEDVFSARREGVRKIADKAGFNVLDDPAKAADEQHRKHLADIAGLKASAVSFDGVIKAYTVGLSRFRVDITSGTLNYLSEADFVAELAGAVAALIADFEAKKTATWAKRYAHTRREYHPDQVRRAR